MEPKYLLHQQMKAVQRFKRLVDPTKVPGSMHSILGQEHELHFVQPPMEIDPDEDLEEFRPYKRVINQGDLRRGGLHRQASSRERGRSPKRAGSGISSKQDPGSAAATPTLQPSSRDDTPSTKRSTSEGTRGHARDPLGEESAYLFVGPSTYDGRPLEESIAETSSTLLQHLSGGPDTSVEGRTEFPDMTSPVDPDIVPIVSESPGACDIDIYETAYREEIERIQMRTVARRDTMTKVFLTRRVEDKKHHLSEVMKLILHGPSEPGPNGRSEPILQIGDKISGAFASAGAAVSALTSQLEERRHRAFTPALRVDPASPNDHHSSSQARMASSLSDVADVVSATAERSKSGLKSFVERVKSPGERPR
jgi:[calcium/calmodulin-dependent protein kinase] kinase